MTRSEVNKLLGLMKANYPHAFRQMSQQEKYMLLNTWTLTLSELNGDIVLLAVMQLISTSKWMPTVAEIREQCRKMHGEAAVVLQSQQMLMQYEARHSVAPESTKIRQDTCRRYGYIQQATEHTYRGGEAGISLTALMDNPAFRQLGSGQCGFELIDMPPQRIGGAEES